MKDYAYLLVCAAPFAAIPLAAVAWIAGVPGLASGLGTFAAVGVLSRSYYRGLRDIVDHGIHNDR